MVSYFVIILLWLSGGLAIHHAFSTWALGLYLLVWFVSFLAWALVRSGSLANEPYE